MEEKKSMRTKLRESREENKVFLQQAGKKCLNCMCNQVNEIKACPILKCELWDYRFGCMPNTKDLKHDKHLLYLQRQLFIGKHNMKSIDLIKEIEGLRK